MNRPDGCLAYDDSFAKRYFTACVLSGNEKACAVMQKYGCEGRAADIKLNGKHDRILMHTYFSCRYTHNVHMANRLTNHLVMNLCDTMAGSRLNNGYVSFVRTRFCRWLRVSSFMCSRSFRIASRVVGETERKENPMRQTREEITKGRPSKIERNWCDETDEILSLTLTNTSAALHNQHTFRAFAF